MGGFFCSTNNIISGWMLYYLKWKNTNQATKGCDHITLLEANLQWNKCAQPDWQWSLSKIVMSLQLWEKTRESAYHTHKDISMPHQERDFRKSQIGGFCLSALIVNYRGFLNSSIITVNTADSILTTLSLRSSSAKSAHPPAGLCCGDKKTTLIGSKELSAKSVLVKETSSVLFLS